jgi:hypothetical protein
LTASTWPYAILQRIATTDEVLWRGAQTAGRNHLINSGMPSFGAPLA